MGNGSIVVYFPLPRNSFSLEKNAEIYKIDEIIELLEKDQGYHFRIHKNTQYIFFGDLDNYMNGIKKFIEILQKFLEEKYKLKFDENEFDYGKIDVLKKFTGTHPAVMKERIAKVNWKFDYDISRNNLKLKDRFKNTLEKITGKRFFDYKNYRTI